MVGDERIEKREADDFIPAAVRQTSRLIKRIAAIIGNADGQATQIGHERGVVSIWPGGQMFRQTGGQIS